MVDTLKAWIEQCIYEFEQKHNVKLDEKSREAFYYAFDEGVKVGEDCGFLL